jgi:predicted ribosome quality control (RQC) complex YloA/Tae2 family protein
MKTIEITFSHFSVIYQIGENATENDRLVEMSHPEDIWFHAKQTSSCHVVALIPSIKLERKEVQKVIRQGSLLCKQHTKKISSIPKVAIMYTKIKNIERTKTIGCVLTKEWKEFFI